MKIGIDRKASIYKFFNLHIIYYNFTVQIPGDDSSRRQLEP